MINYDYTGFTTKCIRCNTEVKTKYVGKKDGVPCYEISCNCKENEMKELKGKYLTDKQKGDMLKDKVAEGDLLVSEGPSGDPLWKKKKKLNENDNENNTLNE